MSRATIQAQNCDTMQYEEYLPGQDSSEVFDIWESICCVAAELSYIDLLLTVQVFGLGLSTMMFPAT